MPCHQALPGFSFYFGWLPQDLRRHSIMVLQKVILQWFLPSSKRQIWCHNCLYKNVWRLKRRCFWLLPICTRKSSYYSIEGLQLVQSIITQTNSLEIFRYLNVLWLGISVDNCRFLVVKICHCLDHFWCHCHFCRICPRLNRVYLSKQEVSRLLPSINSVTRRSLFSHVVHVRTCRMLGCLTALWTFSSLSIIDLANFILLTRISFTASAVPYQSAFYNTKSTFTCNRSVASGQYWFNGLLITYVQTVTCIKIYM